MNLPIQKSYQINQQFYNFINDEVLPQLSVNQNRFWNDLEMLIEELTPVNQHLLQTRNRLQSELNDWHQQHRAEDFDAQLYQNFLTEIGYLVAEGEDFEIQTSKVDEEITSIAGPQLVVPLKNARFALNAANARWGSLYDAQYGSDVIPQTDGLKVSKQHNKARESRVIHYAKDFLDEVFPLNSGSHHDVTSYVVYFNNLLAFFADGCSTGICDPKQFVALCGHKSEPSCIVLKNNGLHVEVQIDRSHFIGANDLAGVSDIKVEAAVSTIMDFEDSIAAVDAEDKVEVYRNWLGLVEGNLEAGFQKNGDNIKRKLAKDRKYTSKESGEYRLHGRSLMLVRNVGHLMDTELMQDTQGNNVPEGIVDAVVTAMIGSLDLNPDKDCHNSRTGSIYIVKPKMHGPEEVAFSCLLFSRVEDMLGLERNTLKLGIMDEERRTTVNLKECIRQAKDRIVFINTGFLDRTGDEIHTSMQAGPFLPKAQIKQQPWIQAYEDNNVDIGLKCGFPGKAQIGKGMWAIPDEMQAMMSQKIEHPMAGASTAWVPSPTAATLHALHYHKVDVFSRQQELQERENASLQDILTIPLLTDRASLSADEISKELENNIQGILGYVVRWVEQGVGCSKVPDINNIGLMEDRATLRISCQHISNWLLHKLCDEAQVVDIMQQMAAKVDSQNQNTPGYIRMTPDTENSLAFNAARELIVKGCEQPNGYTEPLLHKYRLLAKSRKC